MRPVEGFYDNDSLSQNNGHDDPKILRRRISELETEIQRLSLKPDPSQIERISDSQFHELLEYLPDIVMVHQDGVVLYVNQACVTATEYSKEELIGSHVLTYIVPEHRAIAMHNIQRRAAGEIVADYELNMTTKSGSLRTCIVRSTTTVFQGKPAAIIILIDITERLAIEATLRESEEKFRSLTESASFAIMVYQGDKWIYGNAASEQISGYSREELYALHYWDIVAPEHQQMIREQGIKRQAGEAVPSGYAFKIIRKDGAEKWVNLAGGLIHIGGKPAGLISVVDITEQRKVVEALRDSEEHNRLLLTHLPTGIIHFNNKLTITYCNERVAEILQTPREKLLGLDMSMLKDQRPIAAMRVALLGEEGRYEGEYVTTYGGISVWVSMICSPLYDAEGKIVGAVAIMSDISERKMIEERLAQETSGNLIVAELGRVLLASESIEEISSETLMRAQKITESQFGFVGYIDNATGYLICPTMTRDIWDHCKVPEKSIVFEKFGGLWGWVLNNKMSLMTNEPAADSRSSGIPPGHVPINSFLSVPAFYGSVMVGQIALANAARPYCQNDIELIERMATIFALAIRRKLTDEALRESEARYRHLVESANDWIWEVDVNSIYTYSSPHCLEILGYTPEEILGKTPFDLMPPDEAQRVQRIFASIVTDAKPFRGHQSVNQHKDGRLVLLESNGVPILNATGQLVGYRGVDRDITERRRLEEEMLKIQKLESIGTLAGGIAHDFNNLLQGVFGYIALAKMKRDDLGTSMAALEQAENALHTAVNLTNQLLTFSKGGQPVKKQIELLPVINNAVGFALSGSRSKSVVTADEDLWRADADEGQISQVIQNIVLNADQAMPNAGSMEINVRNVHSSTAVLPGQLKEGPYVEICISDTGIGIPEKYLGRIFDPYFTTKDRGSGLGLATSYSIIRNHGGAIDVQSVSGKGTTFCIYIPAVVEKDIGKEKLARVATSEKRGRILVMDDEKYILDLSGEMLKMLGHDVNFAANGDEAIGKWQEAKRQGRPFDIAILDLTIRGGMGGAETLKKLLELDPTVRAVISSGYSNDDAVAAHKKLGFKAVLTKPYKIDELQDIIDELLWDKSDGATS